MKFSKTIVSVIVSLTVGAASSDLHSQAKFTALDGLPSAQEEATSSFAADAEVISIVTPGAFSFQAIQFTFDELTGKSGIWLYTFYSASKEEIASYLVTRLLGYQTFELQSAPFPIPDAQLSKIKTAGQYANSDDMVVRLRENSDYKTYKEKYPENLPQIVSLTQIPDSDTLQLPVGFPLGEATWSINFTGQGDSAMICLVASESGTTICRAATNLSVESATAGQYNATPYVYPNPSTGSFTVSLEKDVNHGETLTLMQADGKVVRQFETQSLEQSGKDLVVDASDVPPGVYFLLIGSDNEGVGVARILIVD
jgi:hypothetical protein